MTEETFLSQGTNGGPSASLSKLDFPPLEVTEFIPFFHTPLYFDGSFLHQKYVVEGRSAAQIAGQVFSSKSTVLKALKEHGIPTREPHKHHGRTKQLRYGQRRWDGRVIKNKIEAKVIEAVKKMRADGISLRKIAEYLDSIGISTKNRGKKWHPEMVRRVLQRHSHVN